MYHRNFEEALAVCCFETLSPKSQVHAQHSKTRICFRSHVGTENKKILLIGPQNPLLIIEAPVFALKLVPRAKLSLALTC